MVRRLPVTHQGIHEFFCPSSITRWYVKPRISVRASDFIGISAQLLPFLAFRCLRGVSGTTAGRHFDSDGIVAFVIQLNIAFLLRMKQQVVQVIRTLPLFRSLPLCE
jgi:hypothetical protein